MLGQIGAEISENPTFWVKFKINSKIQYYGALEKIKIQPEIRQRVKIILK